MSYDIWLEADLGGPEPIVIGNLDWNYTSNCAPMWRKAMPETYGLAGMEGMRAGTAAVVLERGIERMEVDPETYKAMNPRDGWGSYNSVLPALKQQLLAAFRQAPEAKVAISR